MSHEQCGRIVAKANERAACTQVARFAPTCPHHEHLHKETGRALMRTLNQQFEHGYQRSLLLFAARAENSLDAP